LSEDDLTLELLQPPTKTKEEGERNDLQIETTTGDENEDLRAVKGESLVLH